MDLKRIYLSIFILILVAGIISNFWDLNKSDLLKSVYYDFDNYKLSTEQKAMIKEYDRVKINNDDMETFYRTKINETVK